jgi:hypothetical protein
MKKSQQRAEDALIRPSSGEHHDSDDSLVIDTFVVTTARW